MNKLVKSLNQITLSSFDVPNWDDENPRPWAETIYEAVGVANNRVQNIILYSHSRVKWSQLSPNLC